jgi:hypothetical protein
MLCDCDETDETVNPYAGFEGPSLWEAAMKAFDETENIATNFTVCCYTPFQQDYTRILVISSYVRYEVYNYEIPEKEQTVLFAVTYDLATPISIDEKLPRFIDATFFPTCTNVSEILIQLKCSSEGAKAGILGEDQGDWGEVTLDEFLTARVIKGQPCIAHDDFFEDIPCIHITL